MIPIPYAAVVESVVHGRVPKQVQCEQCGHEYLYLLERQVRGQGTDLLFLDREGAEQRARAEAEARLQAVLERAVDGVPCPECGHVQQHMFPYLRRMRHRNMERLGLFLIPVAVLLFLGCLLATAATQNQPNGLLGEVLPLWGVCIVVTLLAPFLIILRLVLIRRYDPN